MTTPEDEHVHTWTRTGGACECGEPVPDWLSALWERTAEHSGGTA